MAQKILSCLIISLLSPTQSYCMWKNNVYSMVIGSSSNCVINGRVYRGNNICCVNGQVYIDGILQSDEDNTASSPETWKCEQQESKVFELDDNSCVSVENNMGNIDVSGHDNPKISLVISKLAATDEDLKNIYAEISQSNNNLNVKTNNLKSSVRALINYSLLIPKSKKFDLNLTNSSGNVSIEDIMGKIRTLTASGRTKICKIIGNSKIETSSGDMSLSLLQGNSEIRSVSGKAKVKKVAGDLAINTSSGDIDIDDITGNTTLETVSGSQTIQNIAESLSCNSSSGDIEASNVAKNFIARSINGRVKAVKIGGNSEIETSSGDIYAIVFGSFHGGAVSGSITLKKNSINAPVTIKTSCGDIELCTDTLDTNLDAETSSGEFDSDFPITISKLSKWGPKRISTQVGSGGQSVRLSSVSGDIKLIKN